MESTNSTQTTNRSQAPTEQNITTFISELRVVAKKSPEHIAQQLNQLADSLETDIENTKFRH